jgi:CRISPR-associated exonuclease Cas4
MEPPKSIPLSALQHYAFCPRQCALIHNEQVWADNWHTAKGNVLHERVDGGEPELRKGVRFERSVYVNAPKLRLVGKLDLLEVDVQSGRYTPVEYKKGKSKIDDCDRVQLCAQALCLEEMLNIKITEGALWYWRTRRRELVEFTDDIRQLTLQTISNVAELFDSLITPKAVYGKHCVSCSLIEICNPKLSQKDRSSAYVQQLFEGEYEETAK